MTEHVQPVPEPPLASHLWADLEVLDQATTADRLASVAHYYVYVLCRPDGTPFYVGKGKGRRAFQHEAEARNTVSRSHKLNLIRQLYARGQSMGYAIAGVHEEEAGAHAQERALVRLYGRCDQRRGPLTNQTDGGEGASNPSAEAQARHRASLGGDAEDPERRVANRFLASIAGAQASVPIKPWATLRRRAHLLRPSPGKPCPVPTDRMAKAIAACAAANGVMLCDGAVIPRRLVIEGVECAIENGCGGDMIAAGVVEPIEPRAEPLSEKLRLTRRGFDAVLHSIEKGVLVDFGILDPL